MNIRPDYLRILEIFLNYEKINNKHIVRISHFMDEFNSIFLGNEDAESVLLEMYALDLIKLVDVDHIFGEGGMLLLEKGWEILKAQRNMELGSMKANDIEELIKRIATIKDKGHKEAFIVTLTEMVNTYRADCNTATISLCGKILEIMFFEILQNSTIVEDLYRLDEKTGKKYPRNDLSIWKLRSLAAKLPGNISEMLPNGSVINTIVEYRNATIHYSPKNYSPSKRVTNGVVEFLIETLDKYFNLKDNGIRASS